jgi:hypothetical protein
MSDALPPYLERDFMHVPTTPAKSYEEARAIINVSPSASAILARRCLEQLLHSLGQKNNNLGRNVDSAAGLPDFGSSSVFLSFSDTIRRIGNISAHPSKLESTDHPFELEYEDALWCLQMLEVLFDFFYEIPLHYEMRLTEFEIRLESYKSRIHTLRPTRCAGHLSPTS